MRLIDNEKKPSRHFLELSAPRIIVSAEDRCKIILQQDITKVHNEINLLVNIRILLAVAVVTATGFIVKDLDSLTTKETQNHIFIAINTSSSWLIPIAIQFASFCAWTKIRVYAAYLRYRELSTWESDWHDFRFQTITNKKDSSYRERILKIDSIGFGSVFLVSLIGQIYTITLLIDKTGLPTQLDKAGILHSIGLIMLILEIVSTALILYKQHRHSQKEFEGKLVDIWRITAKPNP